MCSAPQQTLSVRTLAEIWTGASAELLGYTGERRRRELEMISFWDRRELDKIRRSKYVLPIQKLQRELEAGTAKADREENN
jgi:hypothetical protein